MIKGIFIWIFLIIAPAVLSQTLHDIPGLKLSLHSKNILQLFNPPEIKAAGIKKAYLAKTWGYRDAEGNAENKDTIRVYVFNPGGQIETISRYTSVEKSNFDTIYPKKEVEGYYYDSLITTKTQAGWNTKEVKYLLWAHENSLDTAVIIRSAFDKAGQIIEKQVVPTKFARQLIDCWAGEAPYHLKYQYDKMGRTILIEDLIHKEYHSISYPASGEEVIVYDAQSKKEKFRSFTMIVDKEWHRTITTGEVQVIITKWDKGSGLVASVTVVPAEGFARPTYFELFYE